MNIVIDLKKVQFGLLTYVNQYGLQVNKLPKQPTVNGLLINPNEVAAYHNLYPGELMIERARRLDILDKWTPVVNFQFSANHSVRYTGKKALKMWKAWNSMIYGKKG